MFLCTMTDPATYLFGGPYLCGWSPAIANAAPAVAEDVYSALSESLIVDVEDCGSI